MVKSEEDWQKCQYGVYMNKLGITDFICFEYEEDVPYVYNDNGDIIGSFCTDSCVIVITTLESLLKYNPEFDQHITYPQNWTVIKNFCGNIEIKDIYGDVQIIGIGNTSFHTANSAE